MKTFSTEHIYLLLSTVIFLALSCIAVSKMNRRWQSIMFLVAMLIGSGGIFFRYAMNLEFTWEWRIDVLLVQMLQVCNFNFILLPLMLIRKFELARQYSIYFAMFAACTTLFSIPQSYASYAWNDPALLNFWFNHVFAIALPLWMYSSGILRPRREYVTKVTLAVFCYFTLVYVIGSLMMELEWNTFGCSMSYVFDPKGMPLITPLYNMIGGPYKHLAPLIPLMYGFFYLFSIPFNRCVKFDGNGGGGKVPKMFGAYGEEVKLPHGGFIREGHVLVGWRADPDGPAQFEPGEKIIFEKMSFTLYAVWEEIGDLELAAAVKAARANDAEQKAIDAYPAEDPEDELLGLPVTDGNEEAPATEEPVEQESSDKIEETKEPATCAE